VTLAVLSELVADIARDGPIEFLAATRTFDPKKLGPRAPHPQSMGLARRLESGALRLTVEPSDPPSDPP